jgi:hypothetical protein
MFPMAVLQNLSPFADRRVFAPALAAVPMTD